VIGFALALGRGSRFRAVRAFVFFYNWLFRATPTLLQLIFIWYALPQLWPVFAGSWFSPFEAAFVTLSLNEAAYMSEIIRAGLLSVDPGQEVAARALGMSRRQILRRVIVPQAIRIIIPPTGNEFITLLKLTSLASVISLQELLTASQQLAAVKFQYPAGFSTAEAVAFLRSLRGIRLAGCDVVEVSPSYDGPGQPTALAAANILWELLALRAAAS
jgi:amine acid ABC transporter, permease protein, 3-TM region, His/Glu/Gln/Arg/opine family